MPTGGWQSSRLYVQKTHTSTAAALPTSSSAAPIYDPRTFTTIATLSDHLLLLKSFHYPLRYPCTSGYCKLLLDLRCTSRVQRLHTTPQSTERDETGIHNCRMRRRDSHPQSQNETKIRTPGRSKMRREILSEEQEERRACDTSKIASEYFELRTQGGKGTRRRETCERNKGRERPNSNGEKLQRRCTPSFPSFPLFPFVRFVIPAVMDSSSKPLILFLFVF